MKRAVTRRQAMAGGAWAMLAGAAPATASVPLNLPANPSMLVAGPAGGPVDHWAEVIAAPLGRELLGAGALPWENVGGADGVTGVNQFQARTAPDGATALLLPGTALLAALVGDSRARFDAGAWAPLWGGTTAAVVATRVPLTPGRTVRIAIRNVAGPELEALLALDLIGVEPVPVPAAAPDALLRPDIDAVYLRGNAARAFVAQPNPGWCAAFALSPPNGEPPPRDPAFPGVAQARDLFAPARAADPAGVAAFRAVNAAASLDIALVMPAVAPGAVLAWWRRGCDQLDDAAVVREAAAAASLRQDDSGRVAAQLARTTLDMHDSLSLRTLLAERYHWRPGD